MTNVNEGGMSTPMHIETAWESNPYTVPQPVNQIMMSAGPDTQTGPDGILYLQLGHVMPPVGELPIGPSGNPQLKITTVGSFMLTVERAMELRTILDNVITNTQHIQQGGEPHASDS